MCEGDIKFMDKKYDGSNFEIAYLFKPHLLTQTDLK